MKFKNFNTSTVKVIVAFLICAITIVVFSNTFENEFHLDDYYRVYNNPGIQHLRFWEHFVDQRTMSTLPRIAQFRPLLPLSLSVNFALHGEALNGYHITNLILHLLGVMFCFLVCLELLKWREQPGSISEHSIAIVTSGLFAVHPVSGVLINYVCARDLVMMNLFLLASTYLYLRMRHCGETKFRWSLILMCLLLSTLSKTNTVAMPIFIAAFELTLGKQTLRDLKLWKSVALFSIVPLLYVLYTSYFLGFSDLSNVQAEKKNLLSYPLSQLNIHVFYYLRNFVWPFAMRQMPMIDMASGLSQLKVLLGGFFILSTLGLAFVWRQKRPLLAFCILGYWILLAPTSSIVSFHHLASDYRPYPSSVYFFFTPDNWTLPGFATHSPLVW